MSLLSGLVACWDMREGAGAAVLRDRATYQIDATINMPASGWTDSPFGPCLSTNSGAIYAITDAGVLTAAEFAGGVSMAAWVYPTASGGSNGGQIISVGGYIILDYRLTGGTDRISCEVDGSGTDFFGSSVITPNSEWVFAAFTANPSGSNNLTIYVNGVPDGVGSASITGTVGGRATCIGAHSQGGFNFSGNIFTPMIWNRELSAAEMWQLYASPWDVPIRAPRVAPRLRRRLTV